MYLKASGKVSMSLKNGKVSAAIVEKFEGKVLRVAENQQMRKELLLVAFCEEKLFTCGKLDKEKEKF
jgi:hypothetical protein